MQTNHYERRTELMKYFQHQIGGEYSCPRKMQQVTFFGDTKEGMNLCIYIYIYIILIYIYMHLQEHIDAYRCWTSFFLSIFNDRI